MITKEQLIAIGAENLADILLSIYNSNDDVQKQLDIIVAGTNEDPKKIISLIKKEINALRRSTKFVDYFGSRQLGDRLDKIRFYITEDLMPKSPLQAIELMKDFLNLHESTLNRVDDSSGEVGCSFTLGCIDLGKMYEEISLPITEVTEFVFTCYMNDSYGIFNQIIENFKNSLKEEGLELLKSKIQNVINEKNINVIQRGLQAIADCQKDVDSYIKACFMTTNKLSTYEHLEIARRFIAQWKGTEALKWLDEIDLTQNENRKYQYRELKIQAFELNGEYDKAQQEALVWFEESLCPEVYGQILSHATPEFKESFKLQAVAKAFEFREPHTALAFLMQVQEFEEAIKLTRLRIDQLNGGQYYTLRPTAEIFRKIDPLAATLLYRKMLQAVVDGAKSKYYNYAAKDLVACGNLSTQITNWEIYDDHNKYLQELEIKHKRKVSFWQKYNSILQKQIAKELKQSAKKDKENKL